MSTSPSRWEQLRERRLADPAMKDRYRQTWRSVTQVREVSRRIEDERQRAGLSKAELAQRLGTNPASVRRLLSSASANPTLKTVLGVFDVLGLEVSLRSKQSRTEHEASEDHPDAAPLASS